MIRQSLRVSGIALIFALSACIVEAPPTPGLAPSAPPEIDFAGVVTDVRNLDGHAEFTDAAGIMHEIDTDAYRQIGAYPCCEDLVVLGTDADGAFLATFPRVDELREGCHVTYTYGVDRGAHIELFGVLWRKAQDFEGAVPVDTGYPSRTRFCFDERGEVAGLVADR